MNALPLLPCKVYEISRALSPLFLRLLRLSFFRSLLGVGYRMVSYKSDHLLTLLLIKPFFKEPLGVGGVRGEKTFFENLKISLDFSPSLI